MAVTKYENKIGKEFIYTYFKNRLKYVENASKQSIMNIGSTTYDVKRKLNSWFMSFFFASHRNATNFDAAILTEWS